MLARDRLFGLVYPLFAVVALALGGCGHLMDPYVLPAHLKTESMLGTPAKRYSDDLKGARDEATDYVRELAQAAAEHSQLRNGTALAVGPLAAVSAYKGAISSGDGTKKIITKLTLGAATLLGLSEYFYSPPRQIVYFEGAITAECLIGTTEPYNKISATRLTGELTELKSSTDDARGAVQRLESFLPSIKGAEEATRDITAYVALAKSSISQAEGTYAAGIDLLAAIEEAGPSLRRSIGQLSMKVNKEVQKTEPDIAGIRSIMTAVAASVKPPATTSSTTSSPAAPDPGHVNDDKSARELTALKTPIGQAQAALARMKRAATRIAVKVNEVAAAVKIVGTTDGCTLAAAPSFVIQGGTHRVIQVPSVNNLVVSGATGQLVAQLDGAYAADKVLATPKMDASFYGVVVEAKEGAALGTLKLVVHDSTNAAPKSIDLELVAAAKTTPAPTPAGKKTGGSTPPAPKIVDEVTKKEEVEVIQAGVGLKGKDVDGVAGDTTRKAVKKYQEAHGLLPADGRLTTALLEKIKSAGPPSPGPAEKPQ